MKFKSAAAWLLATVVAVGVVWYTPWDFVLYERNGRLTSELNADPITSDLEGIERFVVSFDRLGVDVTVVHPSGWRTHTNLNWWVASRSCLQSYVVRRLAGQWIVLTDGYESAKPYQPECFTDLKNSINELRDNMIDDEKVEQSWASQS